MTEPASDGRYYCFHHNPDFVEERQAARRLGGIRRRIHKPSDGIDLSREQQRNPGKVLELVWSTINETLALDNSIQRNRCLTQLYGQTLKAIEATDLEKRMSALEERLA